MYVLDENVRMCPATVTGACEAVAASFQCISNHGMDVPMRLLISADESDDGDCLSAVNEIP
jgi:hypothetical protein